MADSCLIQAEDGQEVNNVDHQTKHFVEDGNQMDLDADRAAIVVIDPFCGGSHKRFTDSLCAHLKQQKQHVVVVSFPARKWKWCVGTVV